MAEINEGATVFFCKDGAAHVMAAALNLLAELEQTDDALLTDEVRSDARKLRALVDEWMEVS